MLKKFSKDSIANQSQLKSSACRAVRAGILEQYPMLTPYIDDILPKKASIIQMKCANRVKLYTVNNDVIFFSVDDKYYPTLRIAHKYPFMLTVVQVDKGAIKFVLNGSNVMAPGLTSAGGKMDYDFEEKSIVAIVAEGKESIIALGETTMSRKDILEQNSGIAITNIHCLGDGLWELVL